MYCVGIVMAKIRTDFNVPDSAQCRLWKRHMTNTDELLTKTNETVSEAELQDGQVSEIEVANLYINAVTCVTNHTATDA